MRLRRHFYIIWSLVWKTSFKSSLAAVLPAGTCCVPGPCGAAVGVCRPTAGRAHSSSGCTAHAGVHHHQRVGHLAFSRDMARTRRGRLNFVASLAPAKRLSVATVNVNCDT